MSVELPNGGDWLTGKCLRGTVRRQCDLYYFRVYSKHTKLYKTFPRQEHGSLDAALALTWKLFFTEKMSQENSTIQTVRDPV